MVRAGVFRRYGWENNIPAIFDNLHKLRKGNKIYIEDRKGSNTIFVVREIQIYSKNEDASGVFGPSYTLISSLAQEFGTR